MLIEDIISCLSDIRGVQVKHVGRQPIMINIKPHYLCQLAIFLILSAVASPPQDTSIQRRVNELHHLIWRYYIQPETHLLLTRLDLAGKPLYVTGTRIV
jgi:hypothetical protein